MLAGKNYFNALFKALHIHWLYLKAHWNTMIFVNYFTILNYVLESSSSFASNTQMT
jgi:hypothetical protein